MTARIDLQLSLDLSASKDQATQRWHVQLAGACEIGIPLTFVRESVRADMPAGRTQPVHFDAPPATAQPYRCDGFVGDLAAGGSCRVESLQLVPHCNGTHTETRAHIAQDGPSVQAVLRQQGAFLVPATVVTISPTEAPASDEHYEPPLNVHDRVITRAALAACCEPVSDAFMSALVIRTLPNHPDKQTRRYSAQAAPPFLTLPAAEYLVARGVQHLLVDVPSVDRYHDDGLLSAHHIFFGAGREQATITELIYVPDSLADGVYLLNLQCPSFDTDAAPSRPVLIPLVLDVS